MKITLLASATVLIETKGLRILCDPWLIDGIYYGAWSHYPPVDLEKIKPHLVDLDYIYVSHIHPDHCDKATMAHIRELHGDHPPPVLIHKYESTLLRDRIERMGFEVTEIEHGQRWIIDGYDSWPARSDSNPNGLVSIQIFAADDCDPETCGMAFGCDKVMGSGRGSMQIDSMAVISDGEHTIVNTNDCPYVLSKGILPRIKEQYGEIDLLMVGYGSAGPYPQCYAMDDKGPAQLQTQMKFIDAAAQYCDDLKPRYVMPFAGEYTLSGRLWGLEDWKGAASKEEAAAYLKRRGLNALLLNQGGSFEFFPDDDYQTWYTPIDTVARDAYRRDVLSKRKLDYEDDPEPDDLYPLVIKAYNRFADKQDELGIMYRALPVLELGDGWRVFIERDDIVFTDKQPKEPFVRMTIDPRLLARLLKGPQYAHWNQAEIGSHIQFERVPDVYERGLFRALHELHV